MVAMAKRGRPLGATDYKLELTDNQALAERFLELAFNGERCFKCQETRYLSTRNIAKWPWLIQPENIFEQANMRPEQPENIRVKNGVDQWETLVRLYPRMNISKKDFHIAWKRVGGMGWRRIRQEDGRSPEMIKAIYVSVLEDVFRHVSADSSTAFLIKN